MDFVSDIFIRIKNAQKAGHDFVRLPATKFIYEIARALEANGFIGHIERKGKRIKKTLEIELLHPPGHPAVNGIILLFRPSNRLYVSVKDLPRARRGGVVFVSTSKGVMTTQQAHKQHLGGMLIAEIW